MRLALIVDDDPFFRDILTRLLGSRYRVAAAADAESGLRACAAHSPDLLMLDLCLPDSDALGLLDRLGAAGYGPPVVVFSAGRVEAPMRRALEGRGVRQILDKLSSPREFLAAAIGAAPPDGR